MMSDDCLFCKIAAKQIESNKVYEDDVAFAFHDIEPRAPVHVLIIPKEHIPSLREVDDNQENILGHLLVVASKIAKDLSVSESGYRIAINAGPDAGMAVNHLHVHLLGGRRLKWPPG